MLDMRYFRFCVIWLCGGILFLGLFWGWGQASVIETIRTQNNEMIEQTFYDVDDDARVAVPAFTMTYPEGQPVADVWGRLDPKSITSILASDPSLWLCSRITRENLHFLTRLPYYSGLARMGKQEISQHDAAWLVQKGKDVLEQVAREDLFAVLDALVEEQGGSLVDVYMYASGAGGELAVEDLSSLYYDDVGYQSYIQQGHRALFFLGSDNEWWVLDPLLGAVTAEPQRANVYVTDAVFAAKNWYIYPQTYHVDSHYKDFQGISLQPVSTEQKIVLRAADDMPVYRKPSIKSPTTTVLREHAAAELLDEDDGWYEVRTPRGERGWIEKNGLLQEIYHFPRDQEELLYEQIRLQWMYMWYVDELVRKYMIDNF